MAEKKINEDDMINTWSTKKFPICSNSGEIIGILGTYEDITAINDLQVKMQRQIEFEKLVLEIVLLFVDIKPAGLMNVIEKSLHDIANLMVAVLKRKFQHGHHFIIHINF